MRVNTNGLYVLAKKITEHLGVSYADINAFVYPARLVLSGDLTIDEALEHIPYESHARYDLIGALEAFDQVLNYNPDIPYPDHNWIEDEPLVYDVEYSLRGLGQEAWSIMLNSDSFIEGLFAMTILIGIFISSYPDHIHEDEVDFDPVLNAYRPLKLSILAVRLGGAYDRTRHN